MRASPECRLSVELFHLIPRFPAPNSHPAASRTRSTAPSARSYDSRNSLAAASPLTSCPPSTLLHVGHSLSFTSERTAEARRLDVPVDSDPPDHPSSTRNVTTASSSSAPAPAFSTYSYQDGATVPALSSTGHGNSYSSSSPSPYVPQTTSSNFSGTETTLALRLPWLGALAYALGPFGAVFLLVFEVENDFVRFQSYSVSVSLFLEANPSLVRHLVLPRATACSSVRLREARQETARHGKDRRIS